LGPHLFCWNFVKPGRDFKKRRIDIGSNVAQLSNYLGRLDSLNIAACLAQ
jgi:hypothetical protein